MVCVRSLVVHRSSRLGLGSTRRLGHDDLVHSQHGQGGIHCQAKRVELGSVYVEDLGLYGVQRFALQDIEAKRASSLL